MKKENVVKENKRGIILIFLSGIVLVLFFSGYSMGKEYSNTMVETKAKIAEPILIVENSPIVDINGKKQREYYDFKVKNYRENGEITGVNLDYNIEVISPKEKAISFKLYKDNQEIPLKDNKTSNMKLQNKEIQEDGYQLEIIYDKTQNHSINDILQDVQIKVHSEQEKG